MPTNGEHGDTTTKRESVAMTDASSSNGHKKRRTHEATVRHGSQTHATTPSSFELDLASEPMDIPVDSRTLWARAPVSSLDVKADALGKRVLAQMEIDDVLDGASGQPIIRLYGITKAALGERQKHIERIELVLRENIMGYHNNEKMTFMRITVRQPKMIAPLRFTHEGFRVFAGNSFESNLEYTLRFMIDTHMMGASWIELPAGHYQLCSNLSSSCQIEVKVPFEHIKSHAPEGEWQDIAPLRILSFDIECAGRKGVFPEAKVDPVIQIANVIDPDVVIGYNTTNFDLPYLLDRAAHLNIHRFPYLGRIQTTRTEVKEARFSSKAFGTRDNKAIMMQRDYKLRSYTLNSVCAQFLGEQKEDVHHSIITDLQNGNEETRRRLAVYCLKVR
ncbi:ribonuclease H-like domain-containing protein [Syncephalis pseudoplumigaleata]|uniref:DNA polymerase delta catalytic subunit n=1 Tax=Syncephalis pseudoplumigaleata TaxID=1712513 RepID=A0A4P9Z4E5_9FUNG|nr:ribonuclease H-like domain-containing protein [Syncephalis pseudoplumigaleata]|eukprot:RKP26711.1 ribonuclease H-like domain-containing protein [Syncephalis pseudoplumigaleata]